MSGFEVLNPGILSTYQDLGRVGYGSIGVAPSGVMDEEAYNYLNLLLDNPYGTNALEILLGGVKLKALSDTQIALTGAKSQIRINQKEVNNWRVLNIKKGDILEIGFAKEGVRIYLGVKGGFDIAKSFGSCSTNIKEGIGEKPLKKGDIVPFTCKGFSNSLKTLKSNFIPKYKNEVELRVVLGYQKDMFTKKQKELFFSSTYTVTSQNDRMGYRLSGEKIQPSQNGIISEAISFGAIQIPSHGEPIVLLKERQTIGGYPKIGSVIPVDCFKLAQAKQNDIVKFKEITKEEGVNRCREFYTFFKKAVLPKV